MFKRHPHVAKAFSYLKHIYKHVKHHGKLNFLGVKVDKLKSTFAKKANFCNFLELKETLKQNKKVTNFNLFLKRLKAVCLCFVRIPDIWPIPFQIIEQN